MKRITNEVVSKMIDAKVLDKTYLESLKNCRCEELETQSKSLEKRLQREIKWKIGYCNQSVELRKQNKVLVEFVEMLERHFNNREIKGNDLNAISLHGIKALNKALLKTIKQFLPEAEGKEEKCANCGNTKDLQKGNSGDFKFCPNCIEKQELKKQNAGLVEALEGVRRLVKAKRFDNIDVFIDDALPEAEGKEKK